MKQCLEKQNNPGIDNRFTLLSLNFQLQTLCSSEITCVETVIDESLAVAGVEDKDVELSCLDLHGLWKVLEFLRCRSSLYAHMYLCGVVHENTEPMEARRGC